MRPHEFVEILFRTYKTAIYPHNSMALPITHLRVDNYTIYRWIFIVVQPTLDRSFDMATKKSGKKTAWSSDYNFYTRNLTAEEKETFLDLLAEPLTLTQHVSAVMSEGFKSSLSYDAENETFISSFTCKDVDNVNFGQVLTSRHNDWATAILLGVYKIHFLMGYGKWADKGKGEDWG